MVYYYLFFLLLLDNIYTHRNEHGKAQKEAKVDGALRKFLILRIFMEKLKK